MLDPAFVRRLPFACFALLLLAVGLFADPARLPIPRDPLASATATFDEPELFTTPLGVTPAKPPRSIEQLREQIAGVLEREGVPGVGLALVDREGVTWAGGVGVADLATQKPVDADTQFRAASITKAIVALGVMRLVEHGRLDLDQPLREWMPEIELRNRWAKHAPITLAHALEHTAGFDDIHFNEYYGDETLSPRDTLAINPRSRVARWRPGSRMSYSNAGYTIAGHAIEGASGETWSAYLEREVLAPLQMPTARFHRTPAFNDRLATGYVGRDQPTPYQNFAHAPAGSLLASPRELGNLVVHWLRRGELDGRRIVGPASLDRIERTETLPYPGTDSNYGLGNYGDVTHPVRSRGHDGGLPGFLSSYRYFPELDLGYVVLLNSSHSHRAYADIRALVFAYLAGDRRLPEPPSARPDPDAIAAAVGYYGFASPRMELLGFIERTFVGLRVQADPRGVELRPLLGGGSITLIATGDGGFRQPHEGGTSVRLTANAEGQRILVTGLGGYFEEGSYAWARARVFGWQAMIKLMLIALVWGLGWVLVAGFRRARGQAITPGAAALHGWPAAASLSFALMLALLVAIGARQAYTDANVLSVSLFLMSLVFAACSATAAASAVRANLRPTIHWAARVVPTTASFACFAMAVILAQHHLIAVRIWL